jgi:hypothetical protein
MSVMFDVAGETGVSLHRLLTQQSPPLQGRGDRIQGMSGDTASIRIEVCKEIASLMLFDECCLRLMMSSRQWPGYPSYSKQIASKDWKKKRSPNTREKLAVKVAGAVHSFFQVGL